MNTYIKQSRQNSRIKLVYLLFLSVLFFFAIDSLQAQILFSIVDPTDPTKSEVTLDEGQDYSIGIKGNFTSEEEIYLSFSLVQSDEAIGRGIMLSDILSFKANLGQPFSGDISSDVVGFAITIPQGDYTSTPHNIEIFELIDDDQVWLRPILTLSVANRASATATADPTGNDKITYTINEDDFLYVSFRSPSTVSEENISNQSSFPAIQISGAFHGAFRLYISYNSNSAKESSTVAGTSFKAETLKDFTVTSGDASNSLILLNIPASNTAQVVEYSLSDAISVNPDAILEDDEVVTFEIDKNNLLKDIINSLIAPNINSIITTTKHTIENDDKIELYFEYNSTPLDKTEITLDEIFIQKKVYVKMSGTGTVGTAIEIPEIFLRFTPISDGFVVIPPPDADIFLIKPLGTPEISKSGENYDLPLSIPAYANVSNFSYAFAPIADRYSEENEKVRVQLLKPSSNNNMNFGDISTFTLTIENDDVLNVSLTTSTNELLEEEDPDNVDYSTQYPKIIVSGAVITKEVTFLLNIDPKTDSLTPFSETDGDFEPVANLNNGAIPISIPIGDYSTQTSFSLIDLGFPKIREDHKPEREEAFTLSINRDVNTPNYVNFATSTLDLTIKANNPVYISFSDDNVIELKEKDKEDKEGNSVGNMNTSRTTMLIKVTGEITQSLEVVLGLDFSTKPESISDSNLADTSELEIESISGILGDAVLNNISIVNKSIVFIEIPVGNYDSTTPIQVIFGFSVPNDQKLEKMEYAFIKIEGVIENNKIVPFNSDTSDIEENSRNRIPGRNILNRSSSDSTQKWESEKMIKIMDSNELEILFDQNEATELTEGSDPPGFTVSGAMIDHDIYLGYKVVVPLDSTIEIKGADYTIENVNDPKVDIKITKERVLIPAGDYTSPKRRPFGFTLPDDKKVEENKREFQVEMGNEMGKLWINNTTPLIAEDDEYNITTATNKNYYLVDDDKLIIKWEEESFSTIEGGTAKNYPTLRLSGAILDAPTNLVFSVTDPSGKLNASGDELDYKLIDFHGIDGNERTINIPAKDYSLPENQSIPVVDGNNLVIVDNNYVQDTKKLVFTFVFPLPNQLNLPDPSTPDKYLTTNYLITNDDFITIQFEKAAYSVPEGSPSGGSNDEVINSSLPKLVITGKKISSEWKITIVFQSGIPGTPGTPGPTITYKGAPVSSDTNANDISFSNSISEGNKYTLTIPPKHTEGKQEISVIGLSQAVVIKDDIMEEDETIEFKITNAAFTENSFLKKGSGGSTSDPHKLSSQFTIENDDHLTIFFKEGTYSNKENKENPKMPELVLKGARTQGNYTIRVEVTPNSSTATGRKDNNDTETTGVPPVGVRAMQDYSITTENSNKNILDITITTKNSEVEILSLEGMSIVKDQIVEDDETLTLTILPYEGSGAINLDSGGRPISTESNPNDILLSSKYTIENDDTLTIQFEQSEFVAAEDANNLPYLKITGGETFEEYTINVFPEIIANSGMGEKTEGETERKYIADFLITNPSSDEGKQEVGITIGIANYTKRDNQIRSLSGLSIIEDEIVENDEKLRLTIKVNSGDEKKINKLGATTTDTKIIDSMEYTIKNDDFLIIQFAKGAYEGMEDTNDKLLPLLKISGAILSTEDSPSLSIQLDVLGGTGIVNPGTASTHPDYTINPEVPIITTSENTYEFTVPSGDYTKDSVLPKTWALDELFEIVHDTLLEGNEVINFVIISGRTEINSYPSGGERTIADLENHNNWTLMTSYTIENDDYLFVQFSAKTTEVKEDQEEHGFPEIVVTGATTEKPYNFEIDITPEDASTTGTKPINLVDPSVLSDTYDYSFKGTSDDSNKIELILPIRKDAKEQSFKLSKKQNDEGVLDKYIIIEKDNILEKDEVIKFSLMKPPDNPSINPNDVEGLITESEYTIINDDILEINFKEVSFSKAEGSPILDSSGTTTAEFSITTSGAKLLTEIKINIAVSSTNRNVVLPTGDFMDFSINNPTDPNATNIEVTITPENTRNETNDIIISDLLFQVDDRVEDDEILTLTMTFFSSLVDDIKIGDLEGGNTDTATYTIENDDLLEIGFAESTKTSDTQIILASVKYIENETKDINLPPIYIKGASLEGYDGEVSFQISSLNTSTATTSGTDPDTSQLPIIVTIPKSIYSEITPTSKEFRISDLLLKEDKFIIYDDLKLENDEEVHFQINGLKKTTIDKTSGNEYKSQSKFIILDNEPSLEKSLVNANKVIAFSDGIDAVKITVSLLNNQGNTLEILDAGTSIPISIVLEQPEQRNVIPPPKTVEGFELTAIQNSYTVSYSSIKPVLVRFRILHSGKDFLEKSVLVRFVGPNPGQFTPIKTEDNTPELTGIAPFGAGNSVNIEIHDMNQPDAKIGYSFNNIKVTENGEWTLEDNRMDLPLPDGFYDVSIVVEDRAGNQSRINRFNRSLEIATIPPDKFTFDEVITYIQSPKLSGTANPSTKIQLEIDGVFYPNGESKIEVGEDGIWSITRGTIAPLERGKQYDVKATVFTSTEARFQVFEGNELIGAINITDLPITSNEGFSPNNDGINDSWVIIDIEEHPKNKVSIYNIWGTVVWETDDYNNENNFWSGETQGSFLANSEKLPSGVYFYKIDISEDLDSITGFVTILN